MEVYTFVVRDGAVIDLHRYLDSWRERGLSHSKLNKLRIRLAQVSGTRRAVLEVANEDYSLSLRPLAARPEEIVVDSAGIVDKRENPTRRGEDLGWQHGQLARVSADDGLLIDEAGRIISSIVAPIVMIKDGAAHISAHPRTTPSVALEGVLEILEEQNVEIRFKELGFARAELMSTETWLVSPLYGVRLVSGWLEYGGVVPARTGVDRMGVPTHREVNQLRDQRWENA
ncbi:hypothetical protein QP027_02860 [Corynebacterium breve]|uniref:Uncharacterized protein n=1 Tax=Corynebacterium breve TaxID=3049799 RepID=A0ABY8VFV4_9CORY|nr:hypothetical protein [Corynebacterium breve]WIM68354.1 hypothetical protein QP027_02860 [Corynebacterium breve]